MPKAEMPKYSCNAPATPLSVRQLFSIGMALVNGALGLAYILAAQPDVGTGHPWPGGALLAAVPRGGAAIAPVVHPLVQPLSALVRDRPGSAPPQAIATPPPPIFPDREVLEYFSQVALQAEFGTPSSGVKKWTHPLRIRVYGHPQADDWVTVHSVVRDLNQLVQGIDIQLTDHDPNVELYFVPESAFAQIEPNYEPSNYGFFWTTGTPDGLTHARVLISTTGVTQAERSHLIREELTQVLGLMNDSDRYRDSIFYGPWTTTDRYSALDEAVIRLLYTPAIQPGMTQEQVNQVVSGRGSSALGAGATGGATASE